MKHGGNVATRVQARVVESCQLELKAAAIEAEERKKARELDKEDAAAQRAARRAKETQAVERRMQLYALADGRLATLHRLRRQHPEWSYGQLESEVERIYERQTNED